MQTKKDIIIDCAQQLFLEKGYFTTSVQEIIEASGISKGTFYNYFHSKSDLVLALLHHIKGKIKLEREIIQQKGCVNNKEILIEQIATKMKLHKKKRVFSLYEALVLEDNQSLKKFIWEDHVNEVLWLSERMMQVYGNEIRDHAYDLATSFLGSLHHQLRVADMIRLEDVKLYNFINYNLSCIEYCLPHIIEHKKVLLDEMSFQVFKPIYWDNSENIKKRINDIVDHILHSTTDLNSEVTELLDFISTELYAETPRLHVVINITRNLSTYTTISNELSTQLIELLQFLHIWQKQLEEKK
ncbi:TetR/AcrR family transcriptional regulator [Bacillus massiliigorillae]|uniref:TetR/AcrR family transcriptional regulator n=1 Tax=Bacillus massiliigorillae TaxID=1243664 RepID=UPI00039C696D|nr:TetR/AcrR family transcriptional regulator [Bacillus massiliigorillae]